MFDFDNDGSFDVDNLIEADVKCGLFDDGRNQQSIPKPEEPYLSNFAPRTANVAPKDFTLKFSGVLVQIFWLTLASILIVVLFIALPHIVHWLSTTIIGIFKFLFEIVKIIFCFAYLFLFFFIVGIFVK